MEAAFEAGTLVAAWHGVCLDQNLSLPQKVKVREWATADAVCRLNPILAFKTPTQKVIV